MKRLTIITLVLLVLPSLSFAQVGLGFAKASTLSSASTANFGNTLYITGGNVGIGTNTPISTLSVIGPLSSAHGITLASRDNDNTDKDSRIKMLHRDTDEEPITILLGSIYSASSILRFGGGSGTENAANSMAFYTAANTTTTAGSERVRIDGDGNVGIGTATPVNLLNVDGAYNFFTDSSSVDDSWGFVTTGLEAYTTGMSIYVQIAVVNTDGATLQINALGAKDVHKQHNVALATGDVEVGQILHLVYDGTDFQMLSQVAQ